MLGIVSGDIAVIWTDGTPALTQYKFYCGKHSK